MALTRGTVGRGSTDGAAEELAYDALDAGDEPCRMMRVRCEHATVGCFVRTPSLHGGVAAGSGVFLPPLADSQGDENVAVFHASNIEAMYVSGDAAATTVSWGPVG